MCQKSPTRSRPAFCILLADRQRLQPTPINTALHPFEYQIWA
ncbi:hypothetical protein [Laspinema palackyanum]